MVNRITDFFKKYIPLFLLLCFSGNPIVTHMGYSKILFLGYTLIFFLYILFLAYSQDLKKVSIAFFIVVAFIGIVTFLQQIILGFVSYPGVLRYVAKILLAFSTLLYYKKRKIDFLDTYIKILAFLALVSIPFFILNQIGFYGIPIESARSKSFILYTTMPLSHNIFARNSGMFWEPGANAGYLILALVFVVLKNRKFQIGPYQKEVIWIAIGLITTFSTTGFLILSIMIVFFSFQSFNWGKILMLPAVLLILGFAYNRLEFLNEKIEHQYQKALEMNEDEVSNTRFGALNMDFQYIKDQPFSGNGLHVKTRYRFHPWVTEDIGHGNGMSNFIAIWGIPFFLYWMFCVYFFAYKVSRSAFISGVCLFILILMLQGEQFLNYPIFLSFFVLPYVYENILSVESKFYIVNKYFSKLSVG